MSKHEPIAALATDAAITAAILNTGRAFAMISGALLLLVLILWLLKHQLNDTMIVVAVISALIQAYFAWRVAFDALVFRVWAVRWRTQTDAEDDLRAFDTQVGRRRRVSTSLDVDLATRRSGAMKLFFLQILTGVLQALFTALAIWS